MKRTVWFVLGLLLAVGGTVAAGGGYFGWPKVFDFNSITVGGNTVWHAGNDGAGSGLDADTLRGRNMDDECLGGDNGGNRIGLNECLSNSTTNIFKSFNREVCTEIPYVTHAKVVFVRLWMQAMSVGTSGTRYAGVKFYRDSECEEEILFGPAAYAHEYDNTNAGKVLGSEEIIMPVIVTPGMKLYAKMAVDGGHGGRGFWRVVGYMD